MIFTSSNTLDSIHPKRFMEILCLEMYILSKFMCKSLTACCNLQGTPELGTNQNTEYFLTVDVEGSQRDDRLKVVSGISKCKLMQVGALILSRNCIIEILTQPVDIIC